MMKTINRRSVLASGVAGVMGIVSRHLVGKKKTVNRTQQIQDVRVRCTGVALDGGGLGGPLIVQAFFTSADTSVQAVLTLGSADGFVDGQYYLMSLVPN